MCPIYEYECAKCKEKVEILEDRDSVTTKCPNCLKNTLQRIFSSVRFTFKGGKPT